ncbi:MAG: hypothetical protein U0X20_32410 [Caldilineaceae bacterium]
MKHTTQTKTRPEYIIVEKDGVFKVFDRNQHYRCSFATRTGAQAYIDERTGKTPQRAPEAAQPAAQAS